MNKDNITRHLETIKDWKFIAETIEKNYKFSDFVHAIRFINDVADIAEHESHHPDILLWSWNNVKISLSTHSGGGLSEKDFSLASKIDALRPESEKMRS